MDKVASIQERKIPPSFGNPFARKRYKSWDGGRGGAKSTIIAQCLIGLAASNPMRILCTRETQLSIEQSVHRLLMEEIHRMGLEGYFEILKNAITGKNGSQFLFKGLEANPGSIQSMQSIDICWCEEAQYLSQRSLELLTPTIRKPGSEIWFTWNPLFEDSPMQLFKNSIEGQDYALVKRVNWRDNPWFTKELEIERQRTLNSFPELYEHIWEGKFRTVGASFFDIHRNLEVVAAPHHVDFVFATMDTTLKGGEGNDGTAIIYYALDRIGLNAPLTIIDWDIVEISGSVIIDWAPPKINLAEEYADALQARFGMSGIFIEDKAAGAVVIPQLQMQGFKVEPIPTNLTAMGKEGRAFGASQFVADKKIKITEYAYNKTLRYKGESKNHLLSQLNGFIIGDKNAYKRADDLFDCFTYGAILGLDEAYQ